MAEQTYIVKLGKAEFPFLLFPCLTTVHMLMLQESSKVSGENAALRQQLANTRASLDDLNQCKEATLQDAQASVAAWHIVKVKPMTRPGLYTS